MKILVVGKGGREHALVWKLAQSRRVDKIYAAPGNPGIAHLAETIDIQAGTSPDKTAGEIGFLADFAAANRIDLTVVGPEDLLSAGIADCFAARGLNLFGPTAAAARIECDKAFAKDLMARIGVPTARHRTFRDSAAAAQYVRQQGAPIVVKASGLASGKGAVVAHTEEEALEAIAAIMDQRIFGAAGEEVVIEEYMEGEEASFFAITDGVTFVDLVSAQDHKAVYEKDQGPNTGGMGAYAPAPVMTPERIRETQTRIIRPVLDEMRHCGCPFKGVLYCGLMIGAEGPRVVEFNCRFGDPEAQVVLPLLKTDLVDILKAACEGSLKDLQVHHAGGAAVGVVLASQGYPGTYQTGKEIHGLEQLEGKADLMAFHAGTARRQGRLLTAGGRVLCITAVGADIPAATARAYEAVGQVSFEGIYFRRDIAHRALSRLNR